MCLWKTVCAFFGNQRKVISSTYLGYQLYSESRCN